MLNQHFSLTLSLNLILLFLALLPHPPSRGTEAWGMAVEASPLQLHFDAPFSSYFFPAPAPVVSTGGSTQLLWSVIFHELQSGYLLHCSLQRLQRISASAWSTSFFTDLGVSSIFSHTSLSHCSFCHAVACSFMKVILTAVFWVSCGASWIWLHLTRVALDILSQSSSCSFLIPKPGHTNWRLQVLSILWK